MYADYSHYAGKEYQNYIIQVLIPVCPYNVQSIYNNGIIKFPVAPIRMFYCQQ